MFFTSYDLEPGLKLNLHIQRKKISGRKYALFVTTDFLPRFFCGTVWILGERVWSSVALFENIHESQMAEVLYVFSFDGHMKTEPKPSRNVLVPVIGLWVGDPTSVPFFHQTLRLQNVLLDPNCAWLDIVSHSAGLDRKWTTTTESSETQGCYPPIGECVAL